ncbi:MAG: hypothetical protein GY869_00915 [Planctomycetes bacterium]|nr:hypothetical protein [Planctomycetota bacterium]
MTEFKRQPRGHILLGDSRMNHLDVTKLNNKTSNQWCNLGFGSASLPEMIETFYYADSLSQLANVCIGLNFILFDHNQDRNLVREVKDCYKNPLLYLCNKTVLKSCWLLVVDNLFGPVANVETPPMSREEFWRYQLDVTTGGICREFEYSAVYVAKLRQLVAYCRTRDINVEFIIFPEHQELIARYAEFGRQKEYDRFLAEIPAIAPTHNFAERKELTGDKSLFNDPYHPIDEVYLRIINEVWKQ